MSEFDLEAQMPINSFIQSGRRIKMEHCMQSVPVYGWFWLNIFLVHREDTDILREDFQFCIDG